MTLTRAIGGLCPVAISLTVAFTGTIHLPAEMTRVSYTVIVVMSSQHSVAIIYQGRVTTVHTYRGEIKRPRYAWTENSLNFINKHLRYYMLSHN